MTKAQRIMKLYNGVRTTAEIAKIVGCDAAYVRVVARQRRGCGQSEIDRRYASSALGQATTAKRAPRYLAYVRTYMRVARKTGDRDKARSAGRRAYAAVTRAETEGAA